MLKPLSQKTIEKKYLELGLSKEKIAMLHKYFLCFSNLYGVINIRDAWEVFNHYEGVAVHKKDFVAFSGIVQREAGNPYSVYELKEIYNGEKTDNPLERMLVNNKLVSLGYNKFISVYATVSRQGDKPYYIPDKQKFSHFAEDRFYLTPCGKNMKLFVENLKTNGISKDFNGNPNGKFADLSGASVKGKRLSETVFYTQNEQFDLEYYKYKSKVLKLTKMFNVPASEKILDRIQKYIMTGGILENESPAEEIGFIVKSLDEDFGVELSAKQFEHFAQLFMELNNNSNLWLNCGWSPNELSKELSPGIPKYISIGPNMKKMMESGEMDRDELEERLSQMGIILTDE